MEKRIQDWEPALAKWTVNAPKLHVVAKAQPASSARPTLVPPLAGNNGNGHARDEANPLDELTWEERFWFAFQAIVELERDLEELQVREEYFQCMTCRRECGDV